MPNQTAADRVRADRKVDLALGDDQIKRHAASQSGTKRCDHFAIEGKNLDVVGAMYFLRREACEQLIHILVRIHRNEATRTSRPTGDLRNEVEQERQ